MTYIDLAINAMFTGVGTAFGLWIFERFFKQKADVLHEHVSKVEIKIPKSDDVVNNILNKR